ncbi:DNA replication and repair protein RecF [Candidatus Peribacteria bacterium]|nr:DNA replication and repair protein RecF [Candidatus Peribacteria bacterium]
MRIARLHIERFRSYPLQEMDLSGSAIHVFVGPNGAGKTNIVEAISLLSEGDSVLGRSDPEMVRWGESFYRVTAEGVRDEGERMSFEVACEQAPRKRKAYFLRDVRVARGEFVGTLPTVVFLPQDLSLFTGPPARRRSVLDRTLGQISPEFRRSEEVYGKALKQRGALLKHIVRGTGRREDLATWNAVLAQEGAAITLRRLELLEILQCTLPSELRLLGECWDDARFLCERTGTERTQSGIESELLAALADGEERDLLLQSTGVGPHRDDWTILAHGRILPSFASRGQQRSAVIALLLLLGGYTELQRRERPVILLDDVLSELDTSHQEALLSSFADHQVIITTTHAPERMPTDAVLWDVAHGAVSPGKITGKRAGGA